MYEDRNKLFHRYNRYYVAINDLDTHGEKSYYVYYHVIKRNLVTSSSSFELTKSLSILILLLTTIISLSSTMTL